jgi:hypothetical protein
MQIGDAIRRAGRLRNRVAAARLLTDRCSGTVVSTDPRELGDFRKYNRPWVRGDIPILGGTPEASHQHDGRGSRAATVQIHFAATADVDQAGEILAIGSTGGWRVQRGDERNKNQEDARAEGHAAI